MMPIGHVVKEGKIGNTTYRICDDAYRNRTPEDIDRTLRNIAVMGRRIIINAQKKSQESKPPVKRNIINIRNGN